MTVVPSKPGSRRAFFRPRRAADGSSAQPSKAGFTFNVTPQSWAFGFRNWTAMMLALLAAFWLQLDSASSAAVCVGILALPTRGQALQKGLYRVGATVVGVAVSIVIAGLFAQTRDLFILAVAVWLALCVFAAGLLEGNRAYGAVLSGYTVAIVAVGQIDTPQGVFSAGVGRGAAEVVGIVALAVVNDIFFAPDLLPGLQRKLEAARDKIRGFAIESLRAGEADPAEVASLLAAVTTLRPDITALPNESVSGRARAAAARTAAIALVRQVTAARVVAATLTELGPEGDGPRAELASALADTSGQEAHDLRQKLLDRPIGGIAPERLVARSAALVLLEQACRSSDALDDLRSGRGDTSAPALPLFRSRGAALRNALRAFLVVLITAFFFAVTGWPSTATALVQLAALVGISATNPNPRSFAAGALAAMPLAALAGGVVQFLVLDGVDDFPLLAIAMAPPIFAASLLMLSGNQRLFGAGFLLLVFFPVFLSPENPQSYNPQTFLATALLSNLSVIGLFICLNVILPTTDDMRSGWLLRAGRAELDEAIAGVTPRSPPVAAFRDADRIAQLGQLTFADDRTRFDTLRDALETADLAAALRRLRFALDEPALQLHAGSAMMTARDAYATLRPDRLRSAAETMTAFDSGSVEARSAVRRAASELVFAADLLDRRAAARA